VWPTAIARNQAKGGYRRKQERIKVCHALDGKISGLQLFSKFTESVAPIVLINDVLLPRQPHHRPALTTRCDRPILTFGLRSGALVRHLDLALSDVLANFAGDKDFRLLERLLEFDDMCTAMGETHYATALALKA